MLRRHKTMRLCLLAWLPLLGACASNTPLQTVTEAPRVEKVTLPAALTRPCERTAPGLPDEKATLRDVEDFLPVLAGRLESCADQVEAIQRSLP